jgi:hypothetical protein
MSGTNSISLVAVTALRNPVRPSLMNDRLCFRCNGMRAKVSSIHSMVPSSSLVLKEGRKQPALVWPCAEQRQ